MGDLSAIACTYAQSASFNLIKGHRLEYKDQIDLNYKA